MKTKLRVGDQVVVNVGVDLRKTGKILSFNKDCTKVLVEGMNKKTFCKKKTENDPGGLVKREQYFNVSNVMYYDKTLKKGVRLGYKLEEGKKIRFIKNKDKDLISDSEFKPFSKRDKVVAGKAK